MPIGRVTGREIRKNRDGEKDVLLLTVEVSEPDDIQTVELITQAGEKYNPPDDTTVVILDLGEAWKAAIACDDGVVPPDDLETGERQLYSSKVEEDNLLHKKAIITLRSNHNGDIELNINEEEDFAVRYNELEDAFNELQGKWNDFAAAYVPGGPAVQGLPPKPLPPSTADISTAKINNIKVSGREPT